MTEREKSEKKLRSEGELGLPRTGLDGTLFSTDRAGQGEQRVEVENVKAEESLLHHQHALTLTLSHLPTSPHKHTPDSS